MKIQQVHIKEFQGLQNIDFNPDGHHVILLGDNGRGKSRVIRALQIALGKKVKLPEDIQGKFTVECERQGQPVTFEVKIKDGKPVIEVLSNGLKDNRKGTLAALVGAVDFDVNDFVDLSKTEAGRKKQVEIFKSFMDHDTQVALSKFEAHAKANYDERTELNREITRIKGAIEKNPLQYRSLDTFKQVDVSSLNIKINEAREKNKQREDVERRKCEREDGISKKKTRLAELMLEADRLRDEIYHDEETNKKASEWLNENSTIDTSSMEAEMVNASKINLEYQQAQELKKQREELEKMVEESGELTAKIESIRQCISDTIKQMDSPVEGLTYEGDTLVYNGNPVSIDVLSTSEIMELGVKLKMAENPDLGILFIERGESLGKDRLQQLYDMANANGWQIIMEQVERGQETLKIEIVAD